MDNKHPKSSDTKDQKLKVEKKDQKQQDKNEKNENKYEKVDRPVKWSKNKHSFVVAGNYNSMSFYKFPL